MFLGRYNALAMTGLAARLVAAATGPCDIYAAGDTPCVAAHSTTRALFGSYSDALYEVQRSSDSETESIFPLAPGGVANASAQDAFCASTDCYISIIYDQTRRGNDLSRAPPGGDAAGPDGGLDNLANATAAPITVQGKKAYGVAIVPQTGYRNDFAKGTATGDGSQGIYAVLDGTDYDGECCFDYGNAERSNTDQGAGTMEAINFSQKKDKNSVGAGSGPWIMADLENGLFAGNNRSVNPSNPSIDYRFVTAIVKGEPNHWAIRGGDATKGQLDTFFSGTRPSGGYNPMKLKGAIILGIGGDNSDRGRGTFYEGVMTASFPTDATENAVQANIVAAGYST